MSLSDTSCLPAPPTLVTPSPLVATLCCTSLIVHFGWSLHHLSSRRHLPSAWASASASHCTAAFHPAPLVRLVVVSPLVTLPSPVRLHTTSHCTATSHHTLLTPLVWAPEGTVGWRVAHRTLGQGFKPLRCRSVAPWLGVGAPHVQSGYTLA